MLRVTNTTRGITVGDKIELADTSLKRMFGLLGRRGLDPGGGLWIRPSSGVHTFGMAFSIDVVGLDRDLEGDQAVELPAALPADLGELQAEERHWSCPAGSLRHRRCRWATS